MPHFLYSLTLAGAASRPDVPKVSLSNPDPIPLCVPFRSAFPALSNSFEQHVCPPILHSFLSCFQKPLVLCSDFGEVTFTDYIDDGDRFLLVPCADSDLSVLSAPCDRAHDPLPVICTLEHLNSHICPPPKTVRKSQPMYVHTFTDEAPEWRNFIEEDGCVYICDEYSFADSSVREVFLRNLLRDDRVWGGLFFSRSDHSDPDRFVDAESFL